MRALYWHSYVHKYCDYATIEQVNKKMSNGKSEEAHDSDMSVSDY